MATWQLISKLEIWNGFLFAILSLQFYYIRLFRQTLISFFTTKPMHPENVLIRTGLDFGTWSRSNSLYYSEWFFVGWNCGRSHTRFLFFQFLNFRFYEKFQKFEDFGLLTKFDIRLVWVFTKRFKTDKNIESGLGRPGSQF